MNTKFNNLSFSNILKLHSNGVIKIISDKTIDNVDPGKLKFKEALKNSLPLIYMTIKSADGSSHICILFFKIFITNDFKKMALSFSHIDTDLVGINPYSTKVKNAHIGVKINIKNNDILNSIRKEDALNIINELKISNVEADSIKVITDLGFDIIQELIKYPCFKNINMFETNGCFKIKDNHIFLYENQDICAIIYKNTIYIYYCTFANLIDMINKEKNLPNEYRIRYIKKGEMML